jgi:hypothetical protein
MYDSRLTKSCFECRTEQERVEIKHSTKIVSAERRLAQSGAANLKMITHSLFSTISEEMIKSSYFFPLIFLFDLLHTLKEL